MQNHQSRSVIGFECFGDLTSGCLNIQMKRRIAWQWIARYTPWDWNCILPGRFRNSMGGKDQLPIGLFGALDSGVQC